MDPISMVGVEDCDYIALNVLSPRGPPGCVLEVVTGGAEHWVHQDSVSIQQHHAHSATPIWLIGSGTSNASHKPLGPRALLMFNIFTFIFHGISSICGVWMFWSPCNSNRHAIKSHYQLVKKNHFIYRPPSDATPKAHKRLMIIIIFPKLQNPTRRLHHNRWIRKYNLPLSYIRERERERERNIFIYTVIQQ